MFLKKTFNILCKNYVRITFGKNYQFFTFMDWNWKIQA